MTMTMTVIIQVHTRGNVAKCGEGQVSAPDCAKQKQASSATRFLHAVSQASTAASANTFLSLGPEQVTLHAGACE